MTPDFASLAAILGMAAATYATRAGGLWLMQRFTPSPFVAACLQHTPGAVLAAIIAPAVLAGGLATLFAAAATVLVAARGHNIVLAASAGVATVWVFGMLG